MKKYISVFLCVLLCCVLCWSCYKNESAPSNTSSVDSEDVSSLVNSDSSSVASKTSSDASKVSLPDPIFPISEDRADVKGALYRVGNVGYEYYNYVEKTAVSYANAINKTAEALEGIANVFDMIPPTSIEIYLPDDIKTSINSSNQAKSIQKIYDKLVPAVKTVSVLNTLLQHRDKYLYFRTDHHWSATGAYYAYSDFCKQKGITAHALSEYKTASYPGFLGSFYTDSGKLEIFAQTPDDVVVYYPLGFDNISFQFTDKNGKMIPWPIIKDVSTYPAGLKYSAFAAGDYSYRIAENADITDGSSILIVQESFGNAIDPFFTDHYQTVHIIDYRYWNGKISDFVKEHNIQDVLFVNNISATRNSYLVGKLLGISG